MQESRLFLTQEETDELTGIRSGKSAGGIKLSKLQLQVSWLRTAGIPFTENARGRPIIARAIIEGRTGNVFQPANHAWTPRVLTGRA